MRRATCTVILAAVLWAALSGDALAQRDFDAVEVGIEVVADGVYMLTGAGGNIGASVGADGTFLVDDQFAPLTEKILAALATVTEGPVRFVINTHFHGDHTGGNENLGKAGAVIVAHENVRKRMTMEEFDASVGPTSHSAPPGALPVITFAEGLTFHWNGATIRVFHHEDGHAHTDGDAIIHFVEANVFHMGDTYFNGMYPFIDVNDGGSVQGLIEVVSHVIDLADDDTKIIPGHGPLSDKAELRVYRDMLQSIVRAVRAGIDRGLTLEAMVQEAPTAEYDADWGGGFISAERLIEACYTSLADR